MTHIDEFESDLHRTVLSQLDRVAGLLHLDPDIHVRLRAPGAPWCVDPRPHGYWTHPGVHRYRVHHSTVLGPTKGGLRYDEDVSLGEVSALAMLMSWKCALMGLPTAGPRAASGAIRERCRWPSARTSRGAIPPRSSS